MNTRKLITLLISSSVLAFGATSVYATPVTTLTLYLSDGKGNDVTIVDNGAGDTDSAVGSVSWAGSLGTWMSNVNFTNGQSNSPGTSGLASLDLFSIYATSRRGGDLFISLTDTGYLSPIGPNLAASSSVTGSTTGTASFESQLNSNTIGTLGSYHGDFSGTTGSSVSTTGGFSLTQIANIHHDSFGATDFRSNISVTDVPEPATLALFGLGLIGLAINRRRRNT